LFGAAHLARISLICLVAIVAIFHPTIRLDAVAPSNEITKPSGVPFSKNVAIRNLSPEIDCRVASAKHVEFLHNQSPWGRLDEICGIARSENAEPSIVAGALKCFYALRISQLKSIPTSNIIGGGLPAVLVFQTKPRITLQAINSDLSYVDVGAQFTFGSLSGNCIGGGSGFCCSTSLYSRIGGRKSGYGSDPKPPIRIVGLRIGDRYGVLSSICASPLRACIILIPVSGIVTGLLMLFGLGRLILGNDNLPPWFCGQRLRFPRIAGGAMFLASFFVAYSTKVTIRFLSECQWGWH